jgi:hypothetical protein
MKLEVWCVMDSKTGELLSGEDFALCPMDQYELIEGLEWVLCEVTRKDS